MDEARLQTLQSEYSLSDLEAIQIYRKWSRASWPYLKEESIGLSEKLSICDGVKVFEEFDSKQGSKLGYNNDDDTYFYERWAAEFLLKLWKNPELQWGELHHSDERGAIIEKWAQSVVEKSYEIVTFEGEKEKSGRKFGSKEGIRWFEKWHEGKEDCYVDKWWEAPDRSWGEKFGHEAGRKWSETWERQGGDYMSQTVNEIGDRTWGRIEGKHGEEEWGENWSNGAEESIKDKYWMKDGRKWGVKEMSRKEETITEDWEEHGANRRKNVTRKDAEGNIFQTITGSGDDYDYTDTYEHTISTGLECSRKKGRSGSSRWEQEHTFLNGVHVAQNEGSSDEGSWTELWREDAGMKSALKTGKSACGEWEESWSESKDLKECFKYGKNQEEEWWEEWSETAQRKYCKRRRKTGTTENEQEWREEQLGPALRRTIGFFAENGIRTKEWDEVYQPEPNQ